LIQRGEDWWRKRLVQFFQIGKIIKNGPELIVVVGVKTMKEAISMSVEMAHV
jgi:hypothetical protein